MIPSTVPSEAQAWHLPSVPGWALPHAVASDVEAAFVAGAALNSLDNIVRAEVRWAGAWRQRLALKCAASAVTLAGRTEDEAALRDAWHLRQPGNDAGPAGNILAAWRRLASRSPVVDEATLRTTAGLLGIRWSDELAVLPGHIEALARSATPAPIASAHVVREVQARRPDADLLGWWLADQLLALRLRWPFAIPLLVAQVQKHAFRAAGGRRRVPAEGEGFERAVCVAAAIGAAESCRLAGEIATGAARLQAVAPKLRAKGADEAIHLLLTEDAVSGTLQTMNLSRWGTRRLFERLTALGAVRELSGRSAFRLYGL